METRFRRIIASVLAVAALLSLAGAARADEAFDAAVGLFNRAAHVDQDLQFTTLLRSLRQLGDPELAPFFERLARSDKAPLKVHGVLGLAECGKEHRIDLTSIEEMDDAALASLTVNAALDGNLLPVDEAAELYKWPKLDVGTRTIVATLLVQKGKLTDLGPLREAASAGVPATAPAKGKATNEELKSKALARQSLANLLLLQLGDAEAGKALDELNKSTDPARDVIRQMLLETAARCEFDKIGPWAAGVSAEPGLGRSLSHTALAVAMRFGGASAGPAWVRRFTAATDPADRLRLGLIALRLSPWMDAKIYEPMVHSDNPLLQKMGAAGQAVADKKDIGPAAVSLIGMNYFLANGWALGYAVDHATPEDARTILMALVMAYNTGPAGGKIDRLDDAVNAAQTLAEKDTPAAKAFLGPLLANKATDPLLVQAILLGLIHATAGRPQDVVAGSPAFSDQAIGALVTLLLAKHGEKLTPDQLQELAMSVEGGGLQQDALRIQAAWAYLKITNQVKAAMAQVQVQ